MAASLGHDAVRLYTNKLFAENVHSTANSATRWIGKRNSQAELSVSSTCGTWRQRPLTRKRP
jgi:hypothetical protein